MEEITTLKNKMLSKYFSAFDLICCGEAYGIYQPSNIPKEIKTWQGLENLAINLLDPLVEKFGRPEITYCFSSHELFKKIKKTIYPKLDQHSGSELNSKLQLICPRGGQAIDLYYPEQGSIKIIEWIEMTVSFDRMYFYGDKRPFHISLGPENSRTIIYMKEYKRERRIPRKISIECLKKINVQNFN